MTSTIVLTGATGLIGAQLLTHLVASGHVVIGIGLREDALAKLRTDLPDDGKDRFFPLALDLTEDQAVDTLLDKIDRAGLQPTHLINNARSLSTLSAAPDGTISKRNFLQELELQVVVPYRLSTALVSRYGGTMTGIINVGSQYGIVAPPPMLLEFNGAAPPHYGTAKAAIIQLTRELAVRLAPENIQVNCISFGGVEGRASDDFMKIYRKLSPTGKMLNFDQVLEPFMFLLSKGSSGMTGHNLVVDGGWTIV
jgi:NAD(P)-dependent dehydrogenase (short-subunit alcohol dehydrogenase family)